MSDLRFGNIPDFSEENPVEESTTSKRFLPSPNVMAVVSTILALVGTVVLFSSHTLSVQKSTTTTTVKEVSKVTTLISKPSVSKTSKLNSKINFTFKRTGYPLLSHFEENADPLKKYPFLNDFAAVIEPNVDMEFAIADSDDHAHFTYSVCSTKDLSCQTGRWTSSSTSTPGTVKFDCTPHDTFEVSVKERDSDDNLIGSATGTAVCMYVRREMRALSTEDRNKFIAASAVLNSVPDDKGYKLYGKEYLSSSALVQLHHYNAAQQDQDHIHEGNGFLLQHLKMTNLFEASIQSVDSTLNLPYWDFTIDHAKGLSAYNSDVFGSDVYGTMTQPAHLNNGYLYQKDTILSAKIPDGNWKNLKVELTPYSDIPSGYGYMRAPWNMNPSPYVSRFTQLSKGDILQLPTCAIHYDIMQYDSLMDFYYKISLEPHATVHSLAGGIYGCDMLTDLVDGGYITSPAAVCNDWIFVLKQLYRAGYTTPKTDCQVPDDLQEASCGFTCKAGAEKDLVDLVVSFAPTAFDTNKPDFGRVMAEFICNGGPGGKIFPGEHLESASPADPSFWVIHPTLERLLHAKLLSGGFEDEKWASDPKNDYVCKLASCYDLATDTNGYFDTCCYGHYENDKMFDGSRDVFTGPTNGKFQAASDPRSADYSMPYIYDSFTWEHCEEDFDTLLADMHVDSLSRAAAPTAGRRATDRKVPRPASQEKVRDMKQKTIAYNQAVAAKHAARRAAVAA